MRHSKKIFLQIALVELILLLTVGIAVAWLINYKTNRVTAPNITISGNEFLQISTDGQNWGNTLDFTATQLDHDITGDGINLWVPPLNTNGATAAITDGTWTEATAITLNAQGDADTEEQDADTQKGEYIEIPLYFRSGAPVSVYLGADSYVSPNLTGDNILQTDSKDTATIAKVENPSSYSSNVCTFSRNYIAGAARVALVTVDDEEDANPKETLQFIWIPNETYQLIDNSEADSHYQVKEEGTPETTYGYSTPPDGGATATVTPWADDKIRHTFTTEIDGTKRSNNDLVVTLTKDTSADSSNVYTAHIVVRIWVEGTDREARLALAGGVFNTNLQFIAIEQNGAQN